jgi:dTDP-4-dehydrorhamnose 3,5-epimerase-like enzyme
VNAIIGLTHLAQEEDNIQVIREYLHNIDNSSDFLLGLINDIPDIGVKWPIPEGMELTLSEKDTKWGTLEQYVKEKENEGK